MLVSVQGGKGKEEKKRGGDASFCNTLINWIQLNLFFFFLGGEGEVGRNCYLQRLYLRVYICSEYLNIEYSSAAALFL